MSYPHIDVVLRLRRCSTESIFQSADIIEGLVSVSYEIVPPLAHFLDPFCCACVKYRFAIVPERPACCALFDACSALRRTKAYGGAGFSVNQPCSCAGLSTNSCDRTSGQLWKA